MPRDLEKLASGSSYDLVIVGGGIHGAWAAWDATLRGLSVAIVDRGEFGCATSANSLRIVHGGLRYLTRGDLVRMRESVEERATLLRVAPRFVAPLPVLVPTYRRAVTGRLALGAALLLNDLLSWYRNQGLPPSRAVPNGRIVSRSECRRLFPLVPTAGLTGGALWYDGRLLDPIGLTRAIVAVARARGAVAASQVQVNALATVGGMARGVHATDRVSGKRFEIGAGAVLVAAGPWGAALVSPTGSPAVATTRVEDHSPPGHAFAINVRLRDQLADVAVGVRGGNRYLFLVPDGESTLVGTWYTLPDGSDERTLATRSARALLDALNAACPAARLSLNDVVEYQTGWLPLKEPTRPRRADELAERPRVAELGRSGGPGRVVLVEGVKYTTARRVAERAVDRALTVLGGPRIPCRTAEVIL